MSDPPNTLEMPAATLEEPSTEEALPPTFETGDGATPAPPTQRMPSPFAAEEPSSAGAATEKAISIPAAAARERATLTVMTGLHAGQVFVLDQDETVIGRGEGIAISLDDPAVSRRHARIVRRLDGKLEAEDLGSTNHTFVRGRPIGKAALTSGDRIQLGPNVLLRFALTDETEEQLQRRLYESSTRDALTGTFNRKYFLERLGSEAAYARRHGTALAVLMVDLDHFKPINDLHGHLAGDRVLRAIATAMSRTIRREDVLARIGGEEFAVLARAGGAVDAERLAERLRHAVEQVRVPLADVVLSVTASIGVASLAECAESPPDSALLALADTRLYAAKAAGRNRVVTR